MKVSWLIEQRIILIELAGTLTLEDIYQVNRDIIAHLDRGEKDTHIIVNLEYLESYPNTLNSLYKALTFLQHPNLGWNITIADNRLIQFLSTVLNRVLSRRSVRFVKSYEEALKVIQALDTSLVGLIAKMD